MSTTGNAFSISTNAIEKAYEHEGDRLEEVADVKTDINFVSIFANLIKKMDDSAQSAM